MFNDLQALSSISRNKRLTALANGLVTEGEASIITGSFGISLEDINVFIPWWMGLFGSDSTTGNFVDRKSVV
jgi:hypothetical protein